MATEPYQWTAIEARQAFEAETLTVEDYAKSLLSRIEARDETVKAWAYLQPEQVLAKARMLDKVPKAARGPLFGVAVAVKDVIYTHCMPTQQGSPIYEDDQPELDAASVMILRHAGALILGKTTTTEFASTPVGPKTSNAHDPERTPGGSSSGSGAAVADFQANVKLAPIALGTQTGGSVIRPASFNGVYGFKPTWNAISREGQKICSLILDTLGFFSRSIDDFELLLSVFAVQDDEIPRPIVNGIHNLKFAFLETIVWDHAGPGTRNAFSKGRNLLQAAGAEVEDIRFPSDFSKLNDWHTCILVCDGQVTFRAEYQTAKHDLGQHLQDQVEGKQGYTKKDYQQAFDGIATLRPKWDEIAEKFDAVVVPSAPDEAPKGLGHTGNMIFNSMWTALHVPVVNIPAFKGENGMPIGLSLVTARYKDQALLKVAKEVDKIWIKS